jgi:heat shock protein HslJ
MRKVFVLILLTTLLLLAACQEEATPTPEPEVAAPTDVPAPEVATTEVATEAPPTEEPAAEEPPTEEPTEEAQAVSIESEIVGRQWHWQAYQDTAELNDFTVPDADDYKILFNADGTANIQADCNVVGGSYTLDGASLSISLGPSTMAFCGEESLDQFYLASLEAVASYVNNEGELFLNLMADAGNMVFDRGPLDITPEQISLDTQDLPYSWQAVTVPTSPYDESQPPGPKGIPEHIEILFGITDPAEWDPSLPIMYIIPVNAYREMWEDNGKESVTRTIDNIEALGFSMPQPPPTSGMPALPSEAGLVGFNDIAVQVGRAVPAGQVNETSATQTGYRFVGRWAQDANPVTDQAMRYVYQGFTNDGQYLVSFFYPVTTTELPDNAGEAPSEVMDEFSVNFEGYMTAENERLNNLSTDAWDPDLATLDAVVASLEIEDMLASGLQETTWLWTNGPVQPGSSEIIDLEDPTLYQVLYGLDGTVHVIADCNLASLPYEINWTGMQGGMLAEFGPVTLAECGPDSLSSSFVSSIQASQNYRVLAGGDTLELVLPAGGGTLTLLDLASYESTVDPPDPEPGEPTATVISPVGSNVRTGPGAIYPIMGIAPLGTDGRVVGVSEDGNWWAVFVPGAPNNIAWVANSTVSVENVDNVPVIAAPPPALAPPPPAPPPPTVTPIPTAPPSSDIAFEASRTTINAGEKALLSWSVEGVSAVYMFPVGANYQNYPTTGQGSREVMPGITTTYVLLVFNTDGSTGSESIEITVLNGLTANRWLLQSYSSGETGLRTPLAGTEINARFEATGALSGSAGCNTYSGGFTAYDETLRTSNLGVTQSLCDSPQGIMEQESIYISLLSQAARFSVSAGQLNVFDKNGNRILVYLAG